MKVGLLWDSVSNNTGDQAIGRVLQRALGHQQIPFRIISPFCQELPRDVNTLVIGGGELIRAPEDPFYKVFRIPGRHILNTVGVLDGSETDYLEEYRLVSVRSEADRKRLGRGKIFPCLSILYDEYLPGGELPVRILEGAIGIHLTYALSNYLPELIDWIRTSNLGPIYWLPITPYNSDKALMQVLHDQVPNSTMLPVMAPDEIFRTIGKFHSFVTCSLHGSIFAYSQGVHFMAYGGAAKIATFLSERGLENQLFDDASILITRLHDPETYQGFHQGKVETDRRSAQELLTSIVDQCQEALSEQPSLAHRVVIPFVEQASHAQMIQFHSEMGSKAAALLDWIFSRIRIERFEQSKETRSLGIELGVARTQIGHLEHVIESQKNRDRIYRSSPEARVYYKWMQIKGRLLPFGSSRRLLYDQLLNTLFRLIWDPWRGLRAKINKTRITAFYDSTIDPSRFNPIHAVRDPLYAAHIQATEPSVANLYKQVVASSNATTPLSFAIITVLARNDETAFNECIRAVRCQTYPYWEWLIIKPRETETLSQEITESLNSDERIRILESGIQSDDCSNLNMSLKTTRQDFILPLSPRNTLAPDALFLASQILTQHPDANLIYSDYDHLDERGYRIDPIFLPDWSPELILSFNLFGSFGIFRRKMHGVKMSFDGSTLDAGVWDFYLRASLSTTEIYHLPRILSHVRRSHETLKDLYSSKIQTQDSIQIKLRHHLKQEGIENVRVVLGHTGNLSLRWEQANPRHVSIVIPSKNSKKILKNCIDSLLQKTDYPKFEILLIDTGSDDPAVMDLYDSYEQDSRFKQFAFDHPFNFSRACNFGAQHAAGDLLLFLNNDTEILSSDWLERMVQWFDRPGVGIVGCKLLYPNRTIQHAGVIVGMGGIASHLLVGEDEGIETMFGAEPWYRNFSAVTAACMLVDRKAFDSVSGFNEEYVLNYSDVDLCMKVHQAGWRIVYTPDTSIIHHEHISHKRRIPRSDFVHATERLIGGNYLDGDPYFNPNLSYMSSYPVFRQSKNDQPIVINRRLMKRLPKKEILDLPDDLR